MSFFDDAFSARAKHHPNEAMRLFSTLEETLLFSRQSALVSAVLEDYCANTPSYEE